MLEGIIKPFLVENYTILNMIEMNTLVEIDFKVKIRKLIEEKKINEYDQKIIPKLNENVQKMS